jgi:hypothetical protein
MLHLDQGLGEAGVVSNSGSLLAVEVSRDLFDAPRVREKI